MARAGLYGAIGLLLAGGAQAAVLEVVVANVRNGNGRVRVAACTAETFLKPYCQVNADAKSAPGEVVVVLEVPPGVWAIQAFQDEDEDEQIGRNFSECRPRVWASATMRRSASAHPRSATPQSALPPRAAHPA